jgi:uncharacterized protein
MPFYRTPDVYVVEQPGPKSMAAVGTSTAAFLGQGPDASTPFNEVVAINNWSEFRTRFAPADNYPKGSNLANAVNSFFMNGGGRCYIVNVKNDDPLTAGLRLLEANDEISIILAPGRFDPASHEAQIGHCEKMRDRVCILDAPQEVASIDLLTTVEAAPIPAKAIKKDALATPAPADKPADGLRPRQSSYATLYHPYLYVTDALSSKGEIVPCAASGAMAGIYGRVDGTRGVQKAPANEPVVGALDLEYRITNDEQAILNPAGVNCIRFFSKEGIRVWGARTLDAESSEWRYLNVRRLSIWLEKSIQQSTRFAVFEVNDRSLWKTITALLTGFLTNVWRDGALMGRTPNEAFIVKCDDETNPQESIDMGQLITVIGFAPVKPAEFIIFKISQTHEGATVEVL